MRGLSYPVFSLQLTDHAAVMVWAPIAFFLVGMFVLAEVVEHIPFDPIPDRLWLRIPVIPVVAIVCIAFYVGAVGICFFVAIQMVNAFLSILSITPPAFLDPTSFKIGGSSL